MTDNEHGRFLQDRGKQTMRGYKKKITFAYDVTAIIPFHVINQHLICYGAGEKGWADTIHWNFYSQKSRSHKAYTQC